MVGPGLRGGRLQGRLQGGAPPVGRRPHGHQVQHDQLGSQELKGLELRQRRDGPEDGGDHQGPREPRQPPYTPGLPYCAGPRRGLRRGQPGQRQNDGDGPRQDKAAQRPRGRPHPGPRPQLLHPRKRQGQRHGLPGAPRQARRERRDRPQLRVRDRRRRVGQSQRSLRLPGLPRRR